MYSFVNPSKGPLAQLFHKYCPYWRKLAMLQDLYVCDGPERESRIKTISTEMLIHN